MEIVARVLIGILQNLFRSWARYHFFSKSEGCILEELRRFHIFQGDPCIYTDILFLGHHVDDSHSKWGDLDLTLTGEIFH